MSIQDSLDQLSKNYFTDISEDVSSIYIDMEILQDFRIGALLQTVTVPEEIEYIQAQIPEYNSRTDLETASHFPVLNKTDEELLEIMKQNPLRTAAISPWTKIYNNLHVVLKYLYLNSKNKDTVVRPLKIVVNSGDLLYPLALFDKFAKMIKLTYPEVSVKVANYKRYEAEKELYLDTDMFFLYDHEKFFNSPFMMEMMNSPTYKTRTIYTTPYVNKKLGLDPSEYLKSLTSTGATLNLFFDFFYMPAGIEWSPTPKTGEKPNG